VVLLALSAFFSSSETALTTLNKIRMKTRADKGHGGARTALALSKNYDKTITTILVGNNVVNITVSTLGALLFTKLLGPSGAVVSTVVMSILVLLLGEILPKSYAMSHGDAVAVRLSRPLKAVSVLLMPITAVFTKASRIFRPPGAADKGAPTMTEEELHTFIDHIEEQGVLEEQESELVQSALEFDEISIREILTPRVEMVALDVECTGEELRETLLTERFARLPVYEHNIDNIIGIVYSRDLLQSLLRGETVDLRASLGAAYFAHKSMKLSQLLQNLKTHKANLAVVTDDYGGTLGIVTMRDVLQELVGELWEEGMENKPDLLQIAQDRWEVNGGLDLEALFEGLSLEEQEDDGDFCTVNGWAMDRLQHIPEPGEEFTYEGYVFRVGEMDGRRIHKLIVHTISPTLEELNEQTPLVTAT